MNFMIYIKITGLYLNVSRKKKTYLATINVICYKMKGSAYLQPSLSRIYVTKQTTSFTTEI